MQLHDWLEYLNSLPSGLNRKSLDHLVGIARKLNLYEINSKIITVSGTNGKGSTVVILEAILLSQGFKVGSYISPHLLSYNERIRLNGVDVEDFTLCQAFAIIKEKSGNTTLSYFEFTTLAALLIFSQEHFDFLLLEVGLGGRFDAVNILDADLAIITTVSLDHTQVLGTTRELIGQEKAGIMRPNKPSVVGPNMPASVYLEAQKIGSKIYSADKDFFYAKNLHTFNWYFNSYELNNLPIPTLHLNSAALALMAIRFFPELDEIGLEQLKSALVTASLPGRMQHLICRGCKIILDVAHNQESAEFLALNLVSIKSQGRFKAVFGALQDKDINAIVAPLMPLIERWYLGEVKSSRRATLQELSSRLQIISQNANFALCQSISLSLHQAIAESTEMDTIVVFGSFYTVAEVLMAIYSNNEENYESRK